MDVTVSVSTQFAPGKSIPNRVCCFLPIHIYGYSAVATPINKGLKPKTDEEQARILAWTKETTALRRIADPEELAQTIVFLSSGRASFVSAAILTVNGGRA